MKRYSFKIGVLVLAIFSLPFIIHRNVSAEDTCPASVITADSEWSLDKMVDGEYDCSETDIVIDGATLLVEVPERGDFEDSILNTRSIVYLNGGDLKVVVRGTLYRDPNWYERLAEPETIGQLATSVMITGQFLAYGSLLALNNFSFGSFAGVIGQIYTGKSHRKSLWGLVFDSKSKKPVPFAVVRLYSESTKKLIHTSVTDLEGRYGFPPQVGEYYIEVRHDEFVFPTRTATAGYSKLSESLYLGGVIKLDETKPIDYLIPIDSKTLKVNFGIEMFKMIWSRLQLSLTKGNLYLMFFMMGLNLILVIYSFSYLTLAFLLFYVLMLILLLMAKTKKPRAWGKVFNSISSAPVPTAFVKLYSRDGGKVIDTSITDSFGRYQFFVPQDEYQLLVAVQGYSFPSKGTPKNIIGELGSLIRVGAVGGVLNIDVPVDPNQGVTQ